MTDQSNDHINFAAYHLTTRRDPDRVLDDLFRERDEAIRQLANANRINNELTESITAVSRENTKLKAQAPAELTAQAVELGNAIRQINDVVHRQFALLDGTGSLARVADIRRRQVAKGYTAEHDRTRSQMLRLAGAALANGHESRWPWTHEQFAKLYYSPDRLLHAAALLCAAQDVIDAVTTVVDDREDG